MKELIKQAKANWEVLGKGEKALAKAAVDAQDKGLQVPAFGLGLGSTVWDEDITAIVEAAQKWNIAAFYYASGQTDSVNTLGLFTEAGAGIGSLQRLTLNTTEYKAVGGETMRVLRTTWAFEINVF